jgi:probable F420-dependent oxidoreductase
MSEDHAPPRLGAIIPNEGAVPGRLGIAAMGRAAEAAGADGVWVSDHLVLVDVEQRDYPYAADGRMTWPVETDYYEAFACLATLAAATQRVRVGTAVLVLPQRNALEVAKVAATLDRISGGRMALGVGVGWNRTEMAALGYDPATRGRRMDVMLDVIHAAFTGRVGARPDAVPPVPEGTIVRPLPLRPAGVPLLVGGMGDAALRRAAERGDGWLAIAFAHEWDAARLEATLRDVLARRDRARPGRPFETVLKLHGRPDRAHELPGLAARAAAMGFGEVIVEPPWSEGMDRGAEVIAATRASLALAARQKNQ